MNLIAHIVSALAISEVLGLELLYAILGSIVPDIDYLIGIEHRTLMHSILFLMIIILLFYKKKREVTSFSIGYISHILLDVLTIQGVQLLYPLNTYFSYSLIYSLDLTANLLAIIISGVIILNKKIIREKLIAYSPSSIRKTTYLTIAVIILGAVITTYYNINACSSQSINELLNNPSTFNEKCIKTSGLVCSNIRNYTSNSGNDYEIFELCSADDKITVWMTKGLAQLEENDNITINAVFTTRYLNSSGYELYKVKNVIFSD